VKATVTPTPSWRRHGVGRRLSLLPALSSRSLLSRRELYLDGNWAEDICIATFCVQLRCLNSNARQRVLLSFVVLYIEPCFGSVIQNLQEVKKRGPVSNMKAVIGVGTDNSETGKVEEGLNAWVYDLCGWTNLIGSSPCLCGFFCPPDCSSSFARTQVPYHPDSRQVTQFARSNAEQRCFEAPIHAVSQYDGSNLCFNILCTNLCVNRSILREGQYNIEGNCCMDIAESSLCPCCVATQLLAEVGRRGVVKVMPSLITVNPTPACTVWPRRRRPPI
jgi:Cys-rich protein (TIGR01571 family)